MSLRILIGACVFGLLAADLRSVPADDAPDVVRLLHEWQQASAETRSPDIDELPRYAESHSAHELAAAAELCGPVEARELIRKYSWSVKTDDAGNATLVAVPRDELGKLFFSAVELELPAGSSRPTALRFRDAENRARPVAITVPRADAVGDPAGPLRIAGLDVQLTSLTAPADEENQSAAPPVPEILAAWEAATAAIRQADIEFARYTYDLTTGIEERSTGRLRFEAPHNGVYELRSPEIPRHAVSARTDPQGNPLAVQAAQPMLYCWEQSHILVGRPADRSYVKLAVPKSAGTIQLAGSFDRVWYALSTPQRALPGTVDVHSDNFLKRFEWSVLKHDESRIILQAWPLNQADQQQFSELQVILDPRTHVTQATRLVSADSHLETVHVLKRVLLNDDVPHGDWRPDLSGYTEEDPAPLAPPAEAEPAPLPATGGQPAQ